MKRVQVFHVDAFTRNPGNGNRAGVVLLENGALLTEQQMQYISAKLGYSESAFVTEENDSSADIGIRFFTPKVEVPSCGHATVAAHYTRAMQHNLDSGRVVHRIQLGCLPVQVIKGEQDLSIRVTQGEIEFEDPISSYLRGCICEALGITENELLPELPMQVVSTGHSKVMIPMRDRQRLNGLNPRYAALSEISDEIKCNGFFPFVWSETERRVETHGRMFAPAIGIKEDPVTGNANGPMGAYLVHHGLVSHNGERLIVHAHQGEAMGKPGEMKVIVSIESDQPSLVEIEGEAVIAHSDQICLPEPG